MDAPTQLTLSDLQKRVQLALRQWHAKSVGPSPLEPLLLFQQLLREGATASTDLRQATNQLLLQALQVLGERHKEDEVLLRRSFINKEKDERIADDMHIAHSTYYRYKPDAELRLGELLWELENAARTTQRTRLLRRLSPPSYTHLVGVDEQLAQLDALLSAEEAPWIVALAGMGGLGKTSLADAVVRRLIERGAASEVGWVTARQTDLGWDSTLRPITEAALTLDALVEALLVQLTGEPVSSHSLDERLTLLRSRLKSHPHLIVIDNLETVTDVEALVTALRDLARPTKFLLTSRESLYMHPAIYHYAMPELSVADAICLIRQEADQRNLKRVMEASNEALQAVVEVVGGNPLALRLVTGQMFVYSLETVLDNLRGAHGAQIENLYTFLYRSAWDRLDEPTRRALIVMPLTPVNGANLAYITQVSDLKTNELTQALEKLVRLNLVDVRGDLHERHYAIHNLTRTFLHEQVLRW